MHPHSTRRDVPVHMNAIMPRMLHALFPIYGKKLSLFHGILSRARIGMKFSYTAYYSIFHAIHGRGPWIGTPIQQAIIRPQHSKHATKQNFFLFFLFFLEIGSLSRQSCRACPGCRSCASVVSRHAVGVSCSLRATGLPSWLAHDLENLVGTNLSRDPKYLFSAQFWTVHSVSNISTFNPKILGLNIRAIHGPEEPKPCH